MAASKSRKSAAAAGVTPAVGRKQRKRDRTAPGDALSTEALSTAVAVAEPVAEPAASGAAMHKGVGWALTVLARMHRVELGERLSGLGLFPGQEQVLQALHDHDTMTMGALAELMQVRPPTASKAVARLTAQGMVERVDNAPGDGRLVRVRLTEDGHSRAVAVASLWREAENRLLAGFDHRELKKFRKFLRRAAVNFIESDAQGHGPTQAGSAEGAALTRDI